MNRRAFLASPLAWVFAKPGPEARWIMVQDNVLYEFAYDYEETSEGWVRSSTGTDICWHPIGMKP